MLLSSTVLPVVAAMVAAVGLLAWGLRRRRRGDATADPHTIDPNPDWFRAPLLHGVVLLGWETPVEGPFAERLAALNAELACPHARRHSKAHVARLLRGFDEVLAGLRPDQQAVRAVVLWNRALCLGDLGQLAAARQAAHDGDAAFVACADVAPALSAMLRAPMRLYAARAALQLASGEAVSGFAALADDLEAALLQARRSADQLSTPLLDELQAVAANARQCLAEAIASGHGLESPERRVQLAAAARLFAGVTADPGTRPLQDRCRDLIAQWSMLVAAHDQRSPRARAATCLHDATIVGAPQHVDADLLDLEESLALCLDDFPAAAGAEHANLTLRVVNQLHMRCDAAGQPERSRTALDRVVALVDAHWPDERLAPDLRVRLGGALCNRSSTAALVGDFDAAVADARRAVALLEREGAGALEATRHAFLDNARDCLAHFVAGAEAGAAAAFAEADAVAARAEATRARDDWTGIDAFGVDADSFDDDDPASLRDAVLALERPLLADREHVLARGLRARLICRLAACLGERLRVAGNTLGDTPAKHAWLEYAVSTWLATCHWAACATEDAQRRGADAGDDLGEVAELLLNAGQAAQPVTEHAVCRALAGAPGSPRALACATRLWALRDDRDAATRTLAKLRDLDADAAATLTAEFPWLA